MLHECRLFHMSIIQIITVALQCFFPGLIEHLENVVEQLDIKHVTQVIVRS